jgi:hypothetical protein
VPKEAGISNWLSNSYVKSPPYNVPGWYWQIFNTYLISALQILIGTVALTKKKFVPYGILTVVIAAFFYLAWLFYWFA